MRALPVSLLLSLAACDHVFGIGDPYEDAALNPRLDGSSLLDGSNGPNDAPVLPTPVAHYRFDGNFNEANGGATATCTTSGQTPCTFIAGVYGEAVHFDGSSVGTFALPQALPSFTLMAWVQPNDGELIDLPTATTGPTTDVWRLVIMTNIQFYSQGLSPAFVQGSKPDGRTWIHIAVTYDGSQEVLYADYIVIGQIPVSAIAYGPNTTVYYGARYPNLPVNYYAGAIDDIYLFSTALTPEQIAAYATTPH